MRIPQDIANLLAVSIRDVLWFKGNVYSFLKDCDVPTAILLEVEKLQLSKTPTIKIIHTVLDQLASKGDVGLQAARQMLTKMYYWNDIHSVPPDKKDAAIASLKAYREGYKRFEAQKRFQEEQERTMQKSREDRVKMSTIDHQKLQKFRDEFDQIHIENDRQKRGHRFEKLMNEIFDYYCEKSKGAFKRSGEQIDGLFYFDKHWYYVEIRWREEKATASDISILRDRAKSSYGGDVKALFISFKGFSDECLKSLENKDDERVILMDGYDLRCVLDCKIGFEVLLAGKQAHIIQYKRPFVQANELIAELSKDS